MNAGKTLFAQLMDFVPWSTFTRLVTRPINRLYELLPRGTQPPNKSLSDRRVIPAS